MHHSGLFLTVNFRTCYCQQIISGQQFNSSRRYYILIATLNHHHQHTLRQAERFKCISLFGNKFFCNLYLALFSGLIGQIDIEFTLLLQWQKQVQLLCTSNQSTALKHQREQSYKEYNVEYIFASGNILHNRIYRKNYRHGTSQTHPRY